MFKHALWALVVAGLFSTNTGCVWWRHMWGSWAYYGGHNSCGYCDNCPDGACGGGCSSGYCPPDGNLSSACGDIGCGDCGYCADCAPCLPFNGFFHRLFYSPGPVGPQGYACQGCGELYVCDWINCPPKCDPCDCCGNYVGDTNRRPCYQQSPRVGSLGMTVDQYAEAPTHAPVQPNQPQQNELIEPHPAPMAEPGYDEDFTRLPSVRGASFRGQRTAGVLSGRKLFSR